MNLKAQAKNDRLGRWCVVNTDGAGRGKQAVADNIRTEDMALRMASVITLEDRNAELDAALREAHRVILHEMDNGRTPYMLKAENGGKGLGYFEDVLGGVKRG